MISAILTFAVGAQREADAVVVARARAGGRVAGDHERLAVALERDDARRVVVDDERVERLSLVAARDVARVRGRPGGGDDRVLDRRVVRILADEVVDGVTVTRTPRSQFAVVNVSR